jgi:TP901 family phage tail tape measure protein
MGKGAVKFGSKADKAFLRAEKRAQKFQSITGGILKAGIITRGLGLMQRGVTGVIGEFISFDKAITVAAAKFPEKIGRGTKEFKELEAAARKVGATTEFTAAQAAEGLDFLAMAGFTAEQAMAALPSVVNLATAANMELAEASDIATDTLGAMGLATKDAAQLSENLARVNDVLAATATSANTTVQQMFEAIRSGGPTARDAGASIETFATLLGSLANAGIKGEKAGTALRNVFLRLQSPTDDARKLIKKYAGEIEDANGDLIDITWIMGRLKESTKDLGSVQRAHILDTIFGAKAINSVNILLDDGAENLQDYRHDLLEAGGASVEMANKIRGSLENKLKTLKSAAIEVGFKFIEAFKKDGTEGLETLIETVKKFDVKPVVEQAKEILSWMKSLFKFLWDNRETIKTLVKGFIAFKIAMAGLGLARTIRDFGGLAKSIWKVVLSQQAMAKAGITKPLAPGQLGPAAPISAPAAGVGQLAKSAQGVMTMVGSALSAAVAGVGIGMMIEEAFTGPMNEAATKIRQAAEDAIRISEEAIRTKDPELMVKAQKEISKAGKDMTSKTSLFGIEVPKQLATTESAIQSFESFMTAIGSVFSDDIERTKTPMETYQQNLQNLSDASSQLEGAMKSAIASLQAGKTTVDVNINDAPEGSTVTSKSEGKGAPPVNTNQSGKNP